MNWTVGTVRNWEGSVLAPAVVLQPPPLVAALQLALCLCSSVAPLRAPQDKHSGICAHKFPMHPETQSKLSPGDSTVPICPNSSHPSLSCPTGIGVYLVEAGGGRAREQSFPRQHRAPATARAINSLLLGSQLGWGAALMSGTGHIGTQAAAAVLLSLPCPCAAACSCQALRWGASLSSLGCCRWHFRNRVPHRPCTEQAYLWVAAVPGGWSGSQHRTAPCLWGMGTQPQQMLCLLTLPSHSQNQGHCLHNCHKFSQTDPPAFLWDCQELELHMKEGLLTKLKCYLYILWLSSCLCWCRSETDPLNWSRIVGLHWCTSCTLKIKEDQRGP